MVINRAGLSDNSPHPTSTGSHPPHCSYFVCFPERSIMADLNEHDKELVGWFYPSKEIQSEAYVSSMDEYKELYQKSIEDPAAFWGDIASQYFWKVPPNKENFMDFNFDTRKGKVFVKWMEGAVTNISYNVLDRNVEKGLGNNVAFYW